jgi:serine/threonine protein phosphatase PrpC
MKFSVYQVSRQGGRAVNEDRLGYCYTRDAVLLVLADGLGGHPDGEVAAELAVNTFSRRFLAAASPDLPDVRRFLMDALLAAHQAILDYAQAARMEDNPRTTVVAAVVQGGRFTSIHSGDSRLYWLRQGEVLDRTRDHTLHEQLSAEAAWAGSTPPPTSGVVASFSPSYLEAGQANRNILFTCLGSPGLPLFDASQAQALQEGDRLLLCSDGVWGVQDDAQLAGRLRDAPLKQAAAGLAEASVAAGGRHADNTSLILFEWQTPPDFPETQVIQTGEMAADDFASTIQMAPAAEALAELDAFDDEAIERSIAEINEAIRRTAASKLNR